MECVSFITCLRQAPHIKLTFASPASAGKEYSSHCWPFHFNHSLLLQSRALIKAIHSPARSKMMQWTEVRNKRVWVIYSFITYLKQLFLLSPKWLHTRIVTLLPCAFPLGDFSAGSPTTNHCSQERSYCQEKIQYKTAKPGVYLARPSESSVKDLSDERGNEDPPLTREHLPLPLNQSTAFSFLSRILTVLGNCI